MSTDKEKQNRMFVEKRQLNLARQDLDRQLERKQSQLRREVEMITDQFLDQRAFTGSHMYPKKSYNGPMMSLSSSSRSKFDPTAAVVSKSTMSEDPSEKIKNSDDPEEQYKSLDIYEKFVVQKRKYYPSYLKRPWRVNKTVPELEGEKTKFYNNSNNLT